MNEKLYDLKSHIQWLTEDVLETSSGTYAKRHFPGFMKELNDVIKEERIESLCDVLQLEEIHKELELAKYNFKPNSKNYELAEHTLSQLSSILVDIDKKKTTELREFAINNYDKFYKELLCESQKFKPSRTAEINKEIWAEMLKNEEDILESAEEDFYVEKALLRMSRANKLCINTTEEEDSFLNYLDSDNYNTVFYFALRLNILLSETFPDTLKPQFFAWLKGEEASEPDQAQGRRKGGNTIKKLFKNEKDKEEAVKSVLEYIQNQPEWKEEKPLVNSCWTEIDGKLNLKILDFLKEWDKDNKINFCAPAVYRFLTEDCKLPKYVSLDGFSGNMRETWYKTIEETRKTPKTPRKI